MDTRERSLRIAMLPWLAHGHIAPFIELAKALSKRNFYIYICSTLVNINSFKQTISEKDSILIKIVEIHLPNLPDLPPHYHTTNGLPPHLMSTLKNAMDMAQPSFFHILSTLKPDLVVYDFLQPWVPTMAASLNIPSVLFLTPGAAASSYHSHIGRKKPVSEYPFPSIYLRDYEYNRNRQMFEPTEDDDDGFTDTQRKVNACTDESSEIILIKSIRELEGKYIDFLSNLNNKRYVPVGPLVRVADTDNEHSEITEWLNSKERCSTVFASFGSEYFLSKEEMEELSFGLELSKVNFLWVIRFPVGQKISLEAALPKGFLERVGSRGKVVLGWAPQLSILGHSSIGGFVSHCGWSSVMEVLKLGVPIIAMPMHLDQPLNAKLIVDAGVGEEAVRDKDGNIDRHEVAKIIRKVVAERSGRRLRKKARELSDILTNNGENEIDEVVEELLNLCLDTRTIVVDERAYTSIYREELTYYFRSSPEDRKRRINTLNWWRSNKARDILNVPMSIVASESASSQERQQLGDDSNLETIDTHWETMQ
ncbi:Beta-D-glucosyl crocetin beta-1,6-glucosyltransferase [Capsicum annuum]|nr:Beta-D-glucosyl crocetin beta-1,6-glucosyltransferase [Capsicum annuum]